jgi:hypothetical protein
MSQTNLNPTVTKSNQTKDDDWKNLIEDIKHPNLETEKQRQKALNRLLTEWETEELAEQQETWEIIEKGLNNAQVNI